MEDKHGAPIDADQDAPDLRHWVLVAGFNLLMLVELCVAMYFASANPDAFTSTFMKVFFGLLLPSLVIFFVIRRRLRR